MNNISLVSNNSQVKQESELAAKDVGNKKYFRDGYLLLDSNYLYQLIINHRQFTNWELRVFLAAKASTFKDHLYAERMYNYIDRHALYPARVRSALVKLRAFFGEVKKNSLEEPRKIKLPRGSVKLLCGDGVRLEILLFLFACSKQTVKNRMTFTLPQDFLAEKFKTSRSSIRKAIRRLLKKGILISIHTPSAELSKGQRYSFYDSNFLPELRRYQARKHIKVVSSSVSPESPLLPGRQYPSPIRSSVPDYSSAPLSLPK